MSRLTQETLTIIGASIALAALILTSSASVRGEVQAVRDEIRDVRAEARADRGTFERHIDARADSSAISMPCGPKHARTGKPSSAISMSCGPKHVRTGKHSSVTSPGSPSNKTS